MAEAAIDDEMIFSNMRPIAISRHKTGGSGARARQRPG
jgi:hypothetical protein